jgi:steroid delta-isomerase-like uncharacterized protein
MSTEQNKELVRRCFEAINGGDFAAARDLFAREYRLHVSYSPVPLDRDAAVASWGPFFAAFPDLHHAIEHSIAQGEWVVAHLAITGTHRGDFMGVPPTGKAITSSSISFFRCANGRVIEQRTQFDAVAMMQQIGAIPAPEAATA